MALRIPPLLLLLITASAMWITASWPPIGSQPPPARWWLAVALFAIGISVALAGVAAFRRVATTVNPMAPEGATTIVTSGVYRISRNPMYLGMLLSLVAWAVVLWSPASLVWLLLFVAYLNRFQIGPEEGALRARFGITFDHYAKRVRRWI